MKTHQTGQHHRCTDRRHETMTVVLCLSIILLLAGCGSSEEKELNRYIHRVKLRAVKPIEPLPQFEPLPIFVFPEDDKRRSPFKPKVVEQGFAPNIKRPKQPLEAFPLDALKFVGLLRQGAVIWALIKAPDGFITRVKPGDYMGQNYGRISSIREKEIELDEAIQMNGKWEKKKMVIHLRTKSS
jgi:type IV pilus assembly protein PilP